MKKVKTIVNSWWFKSALYGALATALFIKGEVFYAGIAIGAGLRELFLAFKQDPCEDFIVKMAERKC